MVGQLEEIIDNYDQEHFLCGNILITRNGEELFSKSYGHASIQLNVYNHMDTKFHIASVTKMFIAAAVLKLVEQGLIHLDDHPGKYVEKFTLLHPDIRIHHLLSHTSGLHDIYAVPNLRFEMSKLNIENKDFIDYLIRLNMDFEPGYRWEYSSTGFIICGYILEKVTGMKYEQIFDTYFFSPLQMKYTGIDNPRAINLGRAYGHSQENDKIRNADNDRLSDIDAPGELFSTTRDLDIWCDALFKGKLLNQETMEKMFTPYYLTTYDPNLYYGYGWFFEFQ